MKQHWDNLIEQIQKLINDDAAVINGLRNGKDVSKIKKTFQQNVKSVGKMVEEFAVFVPDPDAEAIELPFGSDVFREAWEDYKDYLNEQFQLVMMPTMEKKRVWRLYNGSKKDEKKAVEMLEYLICSGYRMFFIPTDAQLTGQSAVAESSEETSFTFEKKTI